jgi:hypothetical protein
VPPVSNDVLWPVQISEKIFTVNLQVAHREGGLGCQPVDSSHGSCLLQHSPASCRTAMCLFPHYLWKLLVIAGFDTPFPAAESRACSLVVSVGKLQREELRPSACWQGMHCSRTTGAPAESSGALVSSFWLRPSLEDTAMPGPCCTLKFVGSTQ